jgi:UDP-N-acetyl-D-glucosamine dehydrogenase
MHTLRDDFGTDTFTTLERAIDSRAARAAIIGLGYVGLPLATTVARANFKTIGFDIDPVKISKIERGISYIDDVDGRELVELADADLFSATTNFETLSACDVVIICVPTPLTRQREPDLSFIENTTRTIAKFLRLGQLIVLESTTFPGTTTELVKPILEASGLASGTDFFLGFSPEREDPGNKKFNTHTIPKIVAGDGTKAKRLMECFYKAVVRDVVPVSSPAVAEAAKLTENVFRAVNIALVNELKVVYDAMGIDVWEVIDAAATKPFGYMPFYPGPGLGGHCVPIDPFYLTWKAREYDIATRFIELAGEVNVSMPKYVVRKLEDALGEKLRKSLSAAKVLVMGLAYKKNVADIRESPSLKIVDIIARRGAVVDYCDPHIPVISKTREYPHLTGKRSVTPDKATIACYDAVVLATDHDVFDYRLVAEAAPVIIDTRNAFGRRGLKTGNVIGA